MLRGSTSRLLEESGSEYAQGWQVVSILVALFLVSAVSQIDRILPFVMAEAIKSDLSLSDTQIGLLTGVAFAVCHTLLSLPLARASDRGSPRLVLVACILWLERDDSTWRPGREFSPPLAFTRFGVAFGEAGATPAGHAIIARKIRPERRGLAVGLFAMGIQLGTMLGFAVGGAISDTLGWRAALIGAGTIGEVIGLLALLVIGPTSPLKQTTASRPFLRSSAKLLASPAFRWLFIGAVAGSFAAAPFYAFAVPFLIRNHGFSASEAGLAFGLLQGLMGIVGTLLGGRMFDRAVQSGTGRVLGPPGIVFLIASVTTTAALFAPVGWMTVILLVPSMLSFAFMLPWGFGAAHLVAGKGREAMATSLVMIGSGLLGPALGPLIVGMISDAATAAQIPNGLGLGLLIVPVTGVLTGLAMLIANQRVAASLRRR